MTCTCRCKGAKSKSKCRCSCGGRFHAINSKEEDKYKDGTRSVNENMGGELGETIKKLKGKTFTCLGVCAKKRKINNLLAYPHDGGLADAEGQKWWLYYECEKCGYQTSWHKIENQLHREEVKDNGN